MRDRFVSYAQVVGRKNHAAMAVQGQRLTLTWKVPVGQGSTTRVLSPLLQLYFQVSGRHNDDAGMRSGN